MGKARNIANLVDANGDVIASALDNVPAANLIDDTTPQLGGNLDVNGNAITGTSVNINASNGDLMITATEDGPVALRYDNNLKLTTKSDGVDITGELQADSLDIDGNADIAGTVTVQLLDLGTNNPRIRFDDSDTSNNGEITLDNTSLRIEADEDNAVADSKISFRVDGSEKAFINSDGLNFGDNDKVVFGAGSDLSIYHSGTNSIIEENSGAGSLLIKGTNISFEDGTGAETYATFIKDGAVTLRYDNATKLSTLTNGVDITGTLYADGIALGDNQYLQLGASQDLQIYHDGSNSFIKDAGTGSLRILGDELKFLNAGDNQLKITADTNGAVKLYYSGTQKLTTTSTGVTITGTAVATTQTASVSGSTTLDFGAYQNFILTLTGNITLANPTTEVVGQSGFITFIQTGGYTVSLGTDYETAGGAGITLSASGTDVVPYIVAASGRILLGAPQLAFA